MKNFRTKVKVNNVALIRLIHQRIEERFYLFLGLLLALILSSYLLIYMFFASPRRFAGDFYAVMYDPKWWDGTGVVYGPIVVFERWLVNAFPSLFKIEFFGFLCIALIGLSIALCIKVTQPSKSLTLIYISVLCMNTYFLYSFSVAANPELIELVLLLIMWWGLSNKHIKFSWFVLICAVLTKLVPVILVPLLFLYFSWSAMFLAIFTFASILLIVSTGQKQTIYLSISQILDTKSTQPQPTSEQFLGLSSALARLFGLQPSDNFIIVNNLALCFSVLTYISVLLLTFLIYKSQKEKSLQIKISYLFVLYLSIIPIMHLNAAHRHTFLFLAPVFVGLSYVLMSDPIILRKGKYTKILGVGFMAYSFLPIYLLDLYNFDKFLGVRFGEDVLKSALYLTEPIWLNIALVAILMLYGKSRFLSRNS